MIEFDFQASTRIVFGPGKLETLGELAKELGARRALVVSDPGVVATGYPARAVRSLEQSGIEGSIFHDVHPNPTTDDVAAGAVLARSLGPDLLVGLGGGSSMDCAKGINFVLTGGGRIEDYWGIGKAKQPMLPMIGIPTTAGTGSEAQSYALISDAKTHVKMACGDKRAAFRVAILDPLLTLSQPRTVTALTGIDALSHAIETFVTRRRNALSLAFSRQAWMMLSTNYARVIDEPQDIEARSAMQLGASLAGMAIEHSMLGAAHALANPLTARYGIVHGEAISIMLPHVIRFNAAECGPWYRDMLRSTASQNGAHTNESGAEELAGLMADLARKAGLALRLADRNVPQGELNELAAEAAQQWTARFNPRRVGEGELLGLYRDAY